MQNLGNHTTQFVNIKNLLLFISVSVLAFGCKSEPETVQLKRVGNRGWFTTIEPFATFDPKHESVEIWTPDCQIKVPLIIYAHGGAGFRSDDSARVAMMRRNGFATISFDSYEMNGLDWNFVTRRVTNTGKQNLIWSVFKGAYEYALKNGEWDHNNIFLYGTSNGGRTVIYAGSKLKDNPIKGIISEAPAATGYELGDYSIPTIILFGKLDTWTGKSDLDFVWKRTNPNSPVSIEQWVNTLKAKGRPVEFIFYENAGHLLFESPLEKVTIKRGDKIAFTAYQGADDGVLKKYEKDIFQFINSNLSQMEDNK